MRRRMWRPAAAAAALMGVTAGLVGSPPPVAAAPIVLDWTAEVESQVGGLINQPLTFPQGTFAGEVDLGTGAMSGDIDLPAGTLTFSAFGLLPVISEIKIVPEGPVTGSIDLTDLSVTADLRFDIVMTRFDLWGIGVLDPTAECRTIDPVSTSLTGQLDPTLGAATLSGTYAIGDFANCGWLEGFVNLFTVGPNNTLTADLAAKGTAGAAPRPAFYVPPAPLPATPGDGIRTLDVP